MIMAPVTTERIAAPIYLPVRPAAEVIGEWREDSFFIEPDKTRRHSAMLAIEPDDGWRTGDYQGKRLWLIPNEVGGLTLLVVGWTVALGGSGLPAGLGMGLVFGTVPPDKAGSASAMPGRRRPRRLALGSAWRFSETSLCPLVRRTLRRPIRALAFPRMVVQRGSFLVLSACAGLRRFC